MSKRLFNICFLFSLITFLTACRTNVPANDDFSLSIVNPQTVISVGEQVTFCAELNNLTDRHFRLEHGFPLITLYIYPEGEPPQEGIGATLTSSEMEAHTSIEKMLNTQILEAGNYVLRAFCVFSVNGTDFYLEDSVPLSVTVSGNS